eukprot:9259554-Pyramimonas_sp.AAC.1
MCESCALGKLLCPLNYMWLVSADRNRLDAVHCRCLRRLLGIQHSYISRVASVDVLKQVVADCLIGRDACIARSPQEGP